MTTNDPLKQKRGGRPRGERIEVSLTPAERLALADMASQVGMSKSAFLRSLGLNQPMRSVMDLKATAELAKLHGGLGEIADLLQQWLVEKPGQGTSITEVKAMRQEFLSLQAQVLELMGKVVRDR